MSFNLSGNTRSLYFSRDVVRNNNLSNRTFLIGCRVIGFWRQNPTTQFIQTNFKPKIKIFYVFFVSPQNAKSINARCQMSLCTLNFIFDTYTGNANTCSKKSSINFYFYYCSIFCNSTSGLRYQHFEILSCVGVLWIRHFMGLPYFLWICTCSIVNLSIF